MSQSKYDTVAMRESAGNILVSANAAIDTHNLAWQQTVASVHRLPGFLQGPIMAILTPHDQRFRASFQWQLDTAAWLLSKAESVEQTEQSLLTDLH